MHFVLKYLYQSMNSSGCVYVIGLSTMVPSTMFQMNFWTFPTLCLFLFLLLRNEIDVIEHERIIQHCTYTQNKVRKQCFYYWSTSHSHNCVLNNEHNSHPRMSVERPHACSRATLYFCRLTLYICHFSCC